MWEEDCNTLLNMVTLRSDNRVLTQNAKFAFLTNNYSSGSNTINLTSSVGFNVDDMILIGEMGQESAEIFRIASINSSSGDVVLHNAAGAGGTTLYGHAESSKVYRLPYNQIRFYWTAASGTIADETPVFNTTTPLEAWVDLDPTSFYTTFQDTGHSTGFGWFVYLNSVTSDASSNSNPIPYAGFSANTVAAVFNDFDSLLNVSELKLVTMSDKFSWLNEALAQLKNKLNLSNVEYTVSLPQIITIISGTPEYQLPDDFSDMISISTYDPTNTTTSGTTIDYLPVYKIDTYTGSDTKYYLRNRYVGFVPQPASGNFQFRYRARASRVTSLSDYIDLPDNSFYTLKDWMLFRSGLKFSNSNAPMYLQTFTNSVNMYIQASVKRDANLDSWDIAANTNT